MQKILVWYRRGDSLQSTVGGGYVTKYRKGGGVIKKIRGRILSATLHQLAQKLIALAFCQLL